MVHWCTDLSSFSTEAPQPCGIPGLVCRAKWPGQRGVPGLFLRDRQFQQFQQFQRVINIFAYKCAYIYIYTIYIYTIYTYIYIYSHKCDCNQRQTGRIFPGFEKESSLRRGGRDGSIATTELGDGVLPFQPG